jgi:hypothetical protein
MDSIMVNNQLSLFADLVGFEAGFGKSGLIGSSL